MICFKPTAFLNFLRQEAFARFKAKNPEGPLNGPYSLALTSANEVLASLFTNTLPHISSRPGVLSPKKITSTVRSSLRAT